MAESSEDSPREGATADNGGPCVTPIADLRASALRHYDDLANAACSSYSVIPRAINFYYDAEEAKAGPDTTRGEPTPPWHCNKCGGIGTATSHEDAENQHRLKSPHCNYMCGWNYIPEPPAVAANPAPETPELRDDLKAIEDFSFAHCSGETGNCSVPHDSLDRVLSRIPALLSECTALRASLEEEKARLDWLDEELNHAHDIRISASKLGHYLTTSIGAQVFVGAEGSTVRAAIDAARGSSEKREP